MARHVQFGADADHGSEGLVVHARKSEVETVHSSKVLARQSFCVRYEGGRRQTFLRDSLDEAGGLSPQASRRRASLSADSVTLPAATSKVEKRKAKTAPKGDESDGSEEWDPSAEDEDLPLDSSLGSQFLSSLRVSQMKNQELTSEQVDLLRSIVETAQEILGSQKLLPEASVDAAVAAPAAEAAAEPEPTTTFAPEPRRSVAKVKIQEAAETVDLPAESKAPTGEKIQRSHSEPPEVAASLEKGPTALKHFMDARSVSEIAEGFRYLLKCVELHQDETGASHGPEALPYQKIKSLPGLPWKAQQVWQLLDAQLKKEDYKAKPLRGKSVAVVGAGPVGLRIALQLKLAGASVTVLEKRCEFVRINRLHLWDWVKQDLIQWGAKVFSPPGGTFG